MKTAVVAAALVCAAVLITYGPSVEAVELMAFSIVLALVSAKDARNRRIPNKLLGLAALIRVAYLLALGVLGRGDASRIAFESFCGVLALGGSLLVVALLARRFLGENSIGGGDVKLLAISGLYFGFGSGLVVVALSCVLGVAYGLFAPISKGAEAREGLHRAFPLGPFISLACAVVMVLESPMVSLHIV